MRICELSGLENLIQLFCSSNKIPEEILATNIDSTGFAVGRESFSFGSVKFRERQRGCKISGATLVSFLLQSTNDIMKQKDFQLDRCGQ